MFSFHLIRIYILKLSLFPLLGDLFNKLILQDPKLLEWLNLHFKLIDEWIFTQHHFQIGLLLVDVLHFLREVFEPCDDFIDLFRVLLRLFVLGFVLEFVHLRLYFLDVFMEVSHLFLQFIFDLDSLIGQILFGILDEKYYAVDGCKCLDDRFVVFFV